MRTAPRTLTALLGAALLLGTAACEDATFSLMRQQERELEHNRRLWQASGVRSYAYVLDVDCDRCTADQDRAVEVVVRNGALVSATYYDDGTPADLAFFADYAPVEKQFDLIGRALARRANSVAVLYETRWGLGHPESVLIDPDGFTNDDEIAVFVLTELDILD